MPHFLDEKQEKPIVHFFAHINHIKWKIHRHVIFKVIQLKYYFWDPTYICHAYSLLAAEQRQLK